MWEAHKVVTTFCNYITHSGMLIWKQFHQITPLQWRHRLRSEAQYWKRLILRILCDYCWSGHPLDINLRHVLSRFLFPFKTEPGIVEMVCPSLWKSIGKRNRIFLKNAILISERSLNASWCYWFWNSSSCSSKQEPQCLVLPVRRWENKLDRRYSELSVLRGVKADIIHLL